MKEKTRIYLAAPLFTQAEWQWNYLLGRALEEFHIQVVLPQDAGENMLKGTVKYDPLALFEEHVRDLNEANVVVAILDQPDPDSGTSWECGYAYRAGIPIIGLRTDMRPAGDDEGMPVNLMLAKSCIAFVQVPKGVRDDLSWIANEIAAAIDRINTEQTDNT